MLEFHEYGFYIIFGNNGHFFFWRNIANTILIIIVISLLVILIKMILRRKDDEKTKSFLNSSTIVNKWNGKSVITFPDLSLYNGKLKNNLPHGKGIFKICTFQPLKLRFNEGVSSLVKINKTENGYTYEVIEGITHLGSELLLYIKWLVIINCFALVIALTRMPYGYYTILRILTTFTTCGLSYVSYKSKRLSLTILSLILCIIYNPILPFHIGKTSWQIINIISIPVIIILYLSNRNRVK
jgi:hypothetical protein